MTKHPAQVPDFDSEPEDVLEKGLAWLARATTEMGAQTHAVLVLEPSSLEVAYRRAGPGRDLGDGCGVEHLVARTIQCESQVRDALIWGSEAVQAESPVARFLRVEVA